GTLTDGAAGATLGLTLNGGGSLTLGNLTPNSNTYSGATLITGNSQLIGGADRVFSATSAVTVDSGSKLDLGGYNQTIASLSGAGDVANFTNPGGVNAASTLPTGPARPSSDLGTLTDGAAGATLGLTLNGGGSLTLGNLTPN